LAYGSVIIAVLAFGAVRLVFFSPSSPTVRVASIDRGYTDEAKIYEDYVSSIANSGDPNSFKITDKQMENLLRKNITGIHDHLFNVSKLEADAGAKIIVWAENSAPVLNDDAASQIDEDKILARGKKFALENRVYLGMSLQKVYNPDILLDNKFIMIDPSGKILFEYYKAHPIFPSESAVTKNTSKELPGKETPFGKLSAVICHDMDFHKLLQQAGKLEIDILFAPSYDWKDINPFHSQMAKFRPIEQGFSMVRHAYGGLSTATDYTGRELARMDDITREANGMVSHVPIKGVTTLYSIIKDLFAWICMVILLILIIKVILLKNPSFKS
jgi:apolipoprotein N-acyltransferase